PTVSLYGRVQQEVLGQTLAEEHGIEVEFADASVIHVERPRRTAVGLERFNTPTNPHHTTSGLRITPGAPGAGQVLHVAVSGRDMPLFRYKSAEGFATSTRRHVVRSFEHGLFGWQVTDCRVTVTDIGYTSADGPPSRRGPLPTAHDFRNLTPLVLRQALVRSGVKVCEPVLRVDLEVPTDDAAALARLLGRWGAELTGQMSAWEFSHPRARLVAARLHELQRQLPDLTGGEGILESRFDGYQPVRGRPPARLGWKATTLETAGV